MTTHRLIVTSMLAVSTVLALLYVSNFPVAFENGLSSPAQSLESGNPAPVPASATNGPGERRFDAEALRHLA